MLESGEPGFVANLASIVAMSTMPTQTAYVMSKHAVHAFSEGLFLEMKIRGAPIHVSSVMPGLIRTGIFAPPASSEEPRDAARHRSSMLELLEEHGMDPLEAAESFLSQIAQRKFWVHSHPEDARRAIKRRARFLIDQEEPSLSEQGMRLLGLPV